MNKKCGCKFRLCGCIKANHKKAFSLFQPKHFMSMVEVTTCKCLNKGTTTLSCPSPVFFSLTPPILHPLVSLVCISVMPLAEFLWSCLLCLPVPAGIVDECSCTELDARRLLRFSPPPSTSELQSRV